MEGILIQELMVHFMPYSIYLVLTAGTLLNTTYIILIDSHRNFYHIHLLRSNGGLKTVAYLR